MINNDKTSGSHEYSIRCPGAPPEINVSSYFMKVAFLFLTYDNFTNPSVIKEFTKNQNVYIHPKNPENDEPFFRRNIIKNLVPTEWGTISIVNATFNLLIESYMNPDNQWFILLSQDCVPVDTFDRFEKIN